MCSSVIFSTIIFIIFFVTHYVLWNFSKSEKFGVYHIVLLQLLIISVSVIINIEILKINIDVYLMCSLYFTFGMLYLHFYVGVTRSISIRLLGELIKTDEKKLSIKSIEKIYPAKYMLEHRVETLIEHGWLICDNNNYFCSFKGRLIAKADLILKNIYGIKQSG